MLLRHIVEEDQHAALGLVGEGGEVEGQGPVARHQLVLNIVGLLQGQHRFKGVQVPQQLLIGAAGVDGPLQKFGSGGIAVDEMALPVKGHHAVGHVEKEGVQLVPFVFHGGQGGLQYPGHLVEGAGENADLVGGFHRQLTVEVSGGHPLRADGQLFNGAHHGLGEQKAKQHGDQQADDKGLHDDLEQLAVQFRYRVLVVKNIDDEGVVPAKDGDGHVHIVGGDVALVAYRAAVLGRHGVPGGQQVGGLLPGQGGGFGAAGQEGSGGAVQNIVVPGPVVDAQHTGVDLQDLLDASGTVRLFGGAAEVRHERPAVSAKGAAHLLVEGVDIKAGDAGGQKRAHHCHQRRDEQQEDQRQLHV